MDRLTRCAVAAASLATLASVAYATPPVATADLIWYRFDEPAGSTTTQNFAVPGVGSLNAPVFGHQLGGGVLTGVGGGSAVNFVDTGWDGATGTSSFSIYFEVTNPSVGNTSTNYFFGNPSVSQRAFDDGVAGADGLLFRVGGGNGPNAFGSTTPGTSHEVAFVYDSSVGTAYAYLDGILVDTVAGLSINVTPGQFKVAGYSSNTFTALEPGTMLNDFRVYGRALAASELIPEPASLSALLAPALLALRPRRRR
jgi:hypothetical protein